MDLRELDRALGVRLKVTEIKTVLNALGKRDETAAICRDKKGNPGPDTGRAFSGNLPGP